MYTYIITESLLQLNNFFKLHPYIAANRVFKFVKSNK